MMMMKIIVQNEGELVYSKYMEGNCTKTRLKVVIKYSLNDANRTTD